MLDSCQLLKPLIICTTESLKSKEVCVPSSYHFWKSDSQRCQSEGLKCHETRLYKPKNNYGIATLACFLTLWELDGGCSFPSDALCELDLINIPSSEHISPVSMLVVRREYTKTRVLVTQSSDWLPTAATQVALHIAERNQCESRQRPAGQGALQAHVSQTEPKHLCRTPKL